MFTTLIEPAELAPHCDDPDWAILDCRFELTRPDWGLAAHAAGHIPHALYAHLDRDLSGPVTATSGRHPLPAVESFARSAGSWGIDASVQVVAYDQGPGAYAARLWWLLRWAGHNRVAVLNGGYAAWQQAGFPVSTRIDVRPSREFAVRAGQPAVTTLQLEQYLKEDSLTRGEHTLLDARGADRFAGQNETIDPVAGHIPGALNHPFGSNLDAQGRFLPTDALRSKWFQSLRGQSASQVISMCGSGVTACHNLLALEIAGLPGARLYAGSWSEWIRDPDRPISPGA
jgi:thiosulfate/3-mercaptopyruvate sulfurtransferase